MSNPTVSEETQPKTSSELSQQPQMPRRAGVMKFIAIFCGVIIVALIAGFVPRWFANSAVEEQTNALSEPTVNVLKPQTSTTESELVLPADLRPYMEAPIYARTNGYLKRWVVDIGARVKTGDLLAEIDAPEVDQQLESARGKLSQAQATLQLAEVTAKRYQTLRNAQAVSQQDADEKNADRDADQAAVNSAAADVRQLEKTQGFEKVIAPFDGTVSQRNVDVGALIQTGGTTPLFRMVQSDKLRVYIQVPQESARNVKVGAIGEVSMPEVPGHTFAAMVTRTADNIDVSTRTLLVELELNNSKGEILAGSHAQLKIKLPSAEPRLVLPANTLLFRAEGPQVGIVDANNTVQLRSVKIGRDLGKTLEIISGIEPNDQVIAAPADSLTTGLKVHIAQAQQQAMPAQASGAKSEAK